MQHWLVDRPLKIAAAAALIGLIAGCATPPGSAPGTSGSSAAAAAPKTSSTLPDVTTVAPKAKQYVSIHELNYRTGPNHRFAAKTVLPVGTVVTPNGYVSGSLWQVDTPKYGTGWVDSSGLKPAAG